eukprot:CAMPEP_0113508690 /NCGR_PEP_ID=MMETSP0014_2-20120614/37160_1 /TAXON_ID=2857 /ORGANISM="Nitzschia sp." /LENGTH=427 /DNA_ID=CAMNT_0000404437 /DNA_START=542 /DNA_END=1826 /DNA_ORIENTATION=- /assembly_acc=CAM_ASM_000159
MDSYDDSSNEGQMTVPSVVSQPQAAPHVNDHDVEYPDDDGSGDLEREYTGVFEGPEKTLEVCFRKKDTEGPLEVSSDLAGERAASDVSPVTTCHGSVPEQGAPSCHALATTTLMHTSCPNRRCLSTRTWSSIALLIDLGRKVGLEIDWVGYSRKNFNFPGDQAYPHQSFHQELDYLYSHRTLCDRLDGSGYTLGPLTADHWFVFVADHTIRSHALEIDTDRVLNIMMFDIDEDVGRHFYYDNYKALDGESKDEEVKRISKEQTKNSGISELVQGVIDPRAFEPCGYSMNAILFRSYTTIHITPESGSSYVSFETNQKVSSYKSLVSNVIATFRPKRFVMTLMADELGLNQVKENPLTGPGRDSTIMVPSPRMVSQSTGSKHMIYKRSTLASIKVEDDCCCMMGNWVLKNDISPTQIRANKVRGLSVS